MLDLEGIVNEPQGQLEFAVTRVLAEAPRESASPSLLRAICQTLGWGVALLWKVDREAHVLRCAEAWYDAGAGLGEFVRTSRERAFEPGVGLPGRVWASGEPMWIPDVTHDDNFPRMPFAGAAGLHAGVGFPIRLSGRVLGVMEFFSSELKAPDDDLLRAMTVIGGQIGQLMERLDVETLARAREEHYEAIVVSALDGVVGMDHEGRITEFNPAAERMFGRTKDEALGRPLAETLIPPRLRGDQWAGLRRYLETGESTILGRRLELIGMRADGSEFPAELAIIRVPGDGPPTFTGFVRDITRRSLAEAERNALLEGERLAREEAERATERLRFLTEVSDILGASLDYKTTLDELGRLVVPKVADWFAVDLLDEVGMIENVAVWHVDPTRVALAQEFRRRYPPDPQSSTGAASVIRSGRPQIYPHIDDAMLEASAVDADHLEMMRALQLRSAIVVPLSARGRVLGAMTLIASDPARVYGDDELVLAGELAERAATAIDNARLYTERDHIARVLQQSLLPPSLPEISGFELASFYRPSGSGNDVGGDFYDAFQLPDGDWVLVVGDVCGKGPEAAAVTSLARHSIRMAAMTREGPGKVLAIANREMVRRDGDDRFCSVVVVRIRADPNGGATLGIGTGGHPLPVAVRTDGRLEELGRPGMLLGMMEDAEFAEASAFIAPGECLVLYTDGLIGRRESRFESGALATALSSAPRDPWALVRAARSVAEAFPVDEQVDDVAVLVLAARSADSPAGAARPADGFGSYPRGVRD
jgi:PAS domain S-box-containing protein